MRAAPQEPVGPAPPATRDQPNRPESLLAQDPVDGFGGAPARAHAPPSALRAEQYGTATCPDIPELPQWSAMPEILDAFGIGALQPEPGFLDGVIGLIQRAEHVVGHTPQVPSIFLESFRQPFLLRQLSSCRAVIDTPRDGSTARRLHRLARSAVCSSQTPRLR